MIKRNNIDNSKDDHKVFQFLDSFKAKKCLYCFQEEGKYLAQCRICGYFFCNNIHRKTSHIILHLKQCKHSKISLSPFESELQCEKCRNKDVFQLFFKDKCFLCEDCIDGDDDEKNYFKKLIDEKKINTDILLCPEIPPLANRFDSYSESLITRINNKINDLKKLNLPIVSLNYTKKKKYCILYDTLIKHEKKEIEEENAEDESFDFELTFYIEDKNYLLAEIKKSNQDFQFYPRQLLIVAKATNENKSFLARVINIDKNQNKIIIYFKDLDRLLNDGHYLIKEKDSTASFDRMLDGLGQFKQKNLDLFDKNIQLLIIGKEIKEGKEELSNVNNYIPSSQIPSKLNISELENIKLNKSQENAIRNCFKNKLTLIKGPPGTGKSTVLVILAYHLVKLRKSKNDKILICAPSNRAVDNISFLLQKIKKLKFVRVLSMEREITEDVDITNSLNNLIKQEAEKDTKNKKIKELFEKREKYGFLKGEDNDNYKKIISDYQNKILNPCDIILSTINNSADSRISNYQFPIVIIDEATQALEPDCLLPLYHKAKMVVMIGDEKQLGPTAKSKDSNNTGISISLFERLSYYYDGSSFISTLTEQYRMHKFLYEFSNKHFYNNQMITNGEIKLDENIINNFPWPKKDIPCFFYNNFESEKKENNSYNNEKEIYMIYGVVHNLIKAGVKVENIGIITPYNAQKFRLYEKFENEKYENLRIESVDGFQGMEKEYIIISTVRSNVSGNIGFLSSTKRLNVALTRAKKGVIVLGNSECLARHAGIWRDLIVFYYSKGIIVQGPLSKLEPLSKEEIFIKDIESDEEEENIREKEERHKKIKKEIVFDYLKKSEDLKNSNKKDINDKDDKAAPSIKEGNFINEENLDKIYKKQNKNKGKKNYIEEEDEKEEREENDFQNKKGKKKKNKIVNKDNVQIKNNGKNQNKEDLQEKNKKRKRK